MIKLVIFDLDGVLIDAKEMHFLALNIALKEIDPVYAISIEEHLAVYDGLPTAVKLKLLTEKKGLPEYDHHKVWKIKQEKTKQILLDNVKPDQELQNIFSWLKVKGIKICVASNSIRETVVTVIDKLGLLTLVDLIVSNEDVVHCKPNPEMYFKCMKYNNILPEETLILEDSPVGREAARRSGAKMLPIKNRKHLTKDLIINDIKQHEKESRNKWVDKDLNVLIPMAGYGSRFAAAGYTFPKPLIEVHGKPMIQVIVDNINIDANYIFICLREHYEKFNLKQLLNLISKDCKIIIVDKVTEGAACTSLLAKEFIDNDNSLLIANSDQFIEWDSSAVMYHFSSEHIDAGILTFENCHPKWSYVRTENNLVKEVAEKKVISTEATVGIYYWRHGKDYVKYAEQMIAKNLRVNGEFYVCPVFNEAIADGKKVYTKCINKMLGLGTPEDLMYFLQNYKYE